MSQVLNLSLLVGFSLAFIYFVAGWTGIAVLLLLFMSVLGLVYFNQGKLLYAPSLPNLPKSPSENPMKMRHPSQHNIQTVDLKLKTSDGITLSGWHLKQPNSKRVIIYFHENAGNIGSRIYFIKQLRRFTNSEVILVAYRGYSDSQGQPTQPGIKIDAQAIVSYGIDYAKSNYKKLYILGSSLGGAVGIYAATMPQFIHEIDGLILQNTFTSISDMIDAILPLLSYVKFLQTNHWRSIDLIGYVRAPILFVRSLRDELVPPIQMQTLMNNANQTKFIDDYAIQLGTHNSHWDIDQQTYFSKLVDFFQK